MLEAVHDIGISLSSRSRARSAAGVGTNRHCPRLLLSPAGGEAGRGGFEDCARALSSPLPLAGERNMTGQPSEIPLALLAFHRSLQRGVDQAALAFGDLG